MPATTCESALLSSPLPSLDLRHGQIAFRARDNPRHDGSARPITTRSGRLRARQIGKLLQAACDEYEKLAKPRSVEQRQEHIESIGRILALYQHRRHFRPRRKDRRALTVKEIEEMELPTPGATEEEDDEDE